MVNGITENDDDDMNLISESFHDVYYSEIMLSSLVYYYCSLIFGVSLLLVAKFVCIYYFCFE